MAILYELGELVNGYKNVLQHSTALPHFRFSWHYSRSSCSISGGSMRKFLGILCVGISSINYVLLYILIGYVSLSSCWIAFKILRKEDVYLYLVSLIALLIPCILIALLCATLFRWIAREISGSDFEFRLKDWQYAAPIVCLGLIAGVIIQTSYK